MLANNISLRQSHFKNSFRSEYAVANTPIVSEVPINDILSIDFERIKKNLNTKHGDKLWPSEKCDKIEIKYKRFLALKRNFPQLDMVPSSYIDQFWSEHYLDSENYRNDCMHIFGYELKQLEFYGLNRDSKTRNLKMALIETKNLYLKYFKENYLGYRKVIENRICF